MFGKFKVSKSLLDAVNSVIGTDSTQVQQLDEATSEKVPTPTGTKVYGHRYGDSKKARKDQTKSAVDDLKGPKDKEMKEAAKPDFLDMDKDGNKKESMKKALADKAMKEELKGNQHKIDKNHNNKIDAQDFKILRGKKEVKESDDCVTKPEAKKIADQEVDNHEKGMHKGKKITVKEGSFSERLVAMYEAKSSGTEPTFTDNNIGEKIDTKVRTLDTLKGRVKAPSSYDDAIEHKSSKVKLSAEEKEEGHEDEKADKALVKKLVKKTALKEEEVDEEVKKSDVPAFLRKMRGDKPLTVKDVKSGSKDSISHKDNLAKAKNEEVELDEVSLKTATSAYVKRMGDDGPNEISSIAKATKTMDYIAKKHGVRGVARATKTVDDKYGLNDPVHNPRKAFVKQVMAGVKKEEVEAVEEKVIAGTPGWKEVPKEVKDKSGAVHSPMSRAKDLAKKAFKKVKNETMMGKISN